MDLVELLKRPEGKTLEFKRDLSTPEGALKTMVAFANTAGGALLVGVEDKSRHVRGVRDPLDLEERLANLVSDRIVPRLVPELEILPWRRTQVLAVQVYPSPSRPHYLKREGLDGGVYVRVGSTNRRADRELVEELRRFARGEAFDEQPMPGLDSEALDFRAASESFAPVRRLGRADLETLRLVTADQGRKVPTVGGMLLFGLDRERHFPDAWIQAGRFRGTDKSRTDRNDLDDQLFGTFSRCQDLLRQPPVQAESRADLREKLAVAAGGVVFTTIHKFFPETQGDRHPVLSDRRNIVVIADEAHRSQYDFIDGFARHMRDALPHASFIGFTGTPIELQDANTRAVFGDYISVYDIQRAVEDGATVPIYYESRLAKLALDEAERPKIDPEFEEATEGEEVERKEKLKTKWAQLEAIVGAERRLELVAKDIVEHFEQRLEVLDGKAMIVCMSRRICVELCQQIVRLRPGWQHTDDEQGAIKVVMTGSASDPVDWQPHIRNKPRREVLANRFRDAADPMKLVLVRDMWLTGFDAPSLHTMYVDKPMRGHGLMQAIARVNRVFKDKPGGLVVDYLGLAHELKAALATYTESGGTGRTALDQDEAVAVMLEKHEVCCGLFHGFDWAKWVTGTPPERLGLLPAAQEHILAQENGKDRLVRAGRELSQAFALAVPHAEALRIRADVAFFQAVQAVLAKRAPGEARPEEELDHAVRQIISRAVTPEGVVDIFTAAGLAKPDISILSEEFLSEVRRMPQRNLAVELLQKLLKGELRTRRRKNLVQARSFAELLEQSLRRYQNRAIEAAQVIEELIELAKQMREADRRGEALGLTEDELAFYDALETNDSAVKVLGDETLRGIARELVASVRANVTIDWTVRENVRAQLRVLVKRILRKHGYPPDKQEKATQTVLEQAAVLSAEWATT